MRPITTRNSKPYGKPNKGVTPAVVTKKTCHFRVGSRVLKPLRRALPAAGQVKKNRLAAILNDRQGQNQHQQTGFYHPLLPDGETEISFTLASLSLSSLRQSHAGVSRGDRTRAPCAIVGRQAAVRRVCMFRHSNLCRKMHAPGQTIPQYNSRLNSTHLRSNS
jgi:hypothetical protein